MKKGGRTVGLAWVRVAYEGSYFSVISRVIMALTCIYLLYGVLAGEAATPPVTNHLRDDLFSVTFPNDRDGWACGRFGLVLHTSDGGKTWIRQETRIDYTLSSVHFVDAKNGWAVGDEGTIIHTSDSGRTWQKQKSPVPFFLMGVYFVTPEKGWAVTERTHILHTKDGGKTWAVQFKDVDFILKSVSFSDYQNGWAVGEYGYVYHTHDGGTTWKKQAGEFGISEETGEIVAGNFLFGVTAIDAHSAWAVGIDGYVTRTTDGGKTWNKIDVPTPKVHLFSVAANRAGVVAICGDGILLVSYDSGNTWRSPVFKPPITYGWLYGLTGRGPSDFVAVGLEGAIYAADAGKPDSSWSRVRN